jgi:hypothetical protein
MRYRVERNASKRTELSGRAEVLSLCERRSGIFTGCSP